MDVSYPAMSLTIRGQTVATFARPLLAAWGGLYANFTLFTPIFGANDGMHNYDFSGIYHIRTHRNDRFYRLVFFSELLLLGIKM